MTVYYPSERSNAGAVILTLVIAAVLVLGVLWFIGHRTHEAPRDNLLPSTAGSASASSGLSQASHAASSALSRASVAASTAVSETSADIKAAVNKQKQQEAAERRSGN